MTTARTSGRCRRRSQGVAPHPKTRRTYHVHTSLQSFPQLCPDKHSGLPSFVPGQGPALLQYKARTVRAFPSKARTRHRRVGGTFTKGDSWFEGSFGTLRP